jgi:hypothetical protein
MARPTGLQARPQPMPMPRSPDIETALQGLRGEVAGTGAKPVAPQAASAGMPNGLPPRLQALAGRDPMAAAARFADFQAGRLPAQVAGSVAKPGLPVGPEAGVSQGAKPLARPGGPVPMNGGGLQAPGAGANPTAAANLLDRIPPAVRERIAAMVGGGGPAIGGAIPQGGPGGSVNFGPPMSPFAAVGNQGGGAMPGAPGAVDLPGMGARGAIPGGGFTPGGLPAGAPPNFGPGGGLIDQPYAVPPEVGGMAGSPQSPQFASGGGLQGVPAPPQFDPWTSPAPGQSGGFNPQRFGGAGGGYRQLVQSRMYG